MIDVDRIKSTQTNGINYGISPDDVIARLKTWDGQYGVTTGEITGNSVLIHFDNLPDSTEQLAQEINEFCPDTVSQGFGCYAEMIGFAEETGRDLDPGVAELIDGVDLDEDGYGLILLARALKRDKCICLWWD